MKNICQFMNIVTDCGTFIVACPNIVNLHVNDEHDWFLRFDDEPDLTQGRIAMVGVGNDSCHEIKVTNHPLSELENEYALEKVRSGVECRSGKLFIGGLDVIPGDGELLDARNTYLQGGWIDIEKGAYDLTIYTIDTATMSEEHLYCKESTAEIIIQFKPRTNHFKALAEAPSINLL